MSYTYSSEKVATWRDMITDAMTEVGDTWDNVVAIAPTDLDLDRQFNRHYGHSQGAPFTLWTETRVYFPAVYDGAEWVESAPRNPSFEAMNHVGGE